MTSSDSVPCQSGIQVDAGSSIWRDPSAWAIPTSVLVIDLVTEKTSCAASGPLSFQYHSPSTCPRWATRKQFDPAAFASAASRSSAALSNCGG